MGNIRSGLLKGNELAKAIPNFIMMLPRHDQMERRRVMARFSVRQLAPQRPGNFARREVTIFSKDTLGAFL